MTWEPVKKDSVSPSSSFSFPPPFCGFGLGRAIEQFNDADAVVLRINA